jgi:hypothetical protein
MARQGEARLGWQGLTIMARHQRARLTNFLAGRVVVVNELQRSAFEFPAAHASQVGLEHFRVLTHSPYNASVGLSLNR